MSRTGRGDRTERTSVLVCRGCCCGTLSKHPTVDHAGHLERLRAAMPAGTTDKLWTVDCLGQCDRSNVVVVRVGVSRRRWFGRMLADDDVAALAEWVASGASAELPSALASHEFAPDQPVLATLPMLQADHHALADAAEAMLRAGAATWTMGVHGAVAEFGPRIIDRARVQRTGDTIQAIAHDAAMRLRFSPDVHAFALGPRAMVLGVVAPAGQVTRSVVSHLGPDAEAMLPDGHGLPLIDLGPVQPAAAFCIRTDPATELVIQPELGSEWRTMLARVGTRLVDLSPQRVVTSLIGRIEIGTRIPRPDEPSPTGSHTHLLAGELELGLALPPGVALPLGFVPAAIVHPSPEFDLSGIMGR
jgi:predicted metal-binding protein